MTLENMKAHSFRQSLVLACGTVFGIYALSAALFRTDALALLYLYVVPFYVMFEVSFDRPVDTWFVVHCALSVIASVSVVAVLDYWLCSKVRGSWLMQVVRVLLQIVCYIGQVIAVLIAVKLLSA